MRTSVILFLAPSIIFVAVSCTSDHRPNANLNASANGNATKPASTPYAFSLPEDPYEEIKAATDRLTQTPSTVRLDATGYLKQKVAMFRQEVDFEFKQKEKPIWFFDTDTRLDGVTRARTVKDIGSIVLQKCEEVPIGSSGEGGGSDNFENHPAYSWKCEITVIDQAIPAVIARKTFETAKNTTLTGNHRKMNTPKPVEAIARYLNSLHRK